MTSMSITVNEYTNRVLGVIKEKFGLKDKAAALNKFADMFGEEFVEREVKDEREVWNWDLGLVNVCGFIFNCATAIHSHLSPYPIEQI